ncbi:hypothetical protein ZIOFF_014717 [Zingiber officinale]|uniref:Uncharacterized protein n=1 Tax=Zingiber officinale TaxID=94328 RepID=A0A8J5HWT7_ZINOF|nr:hypothetical protein ZIOFF_014717 [Zingiber officinale]
MKVVELADKAPKQQRQKETERNQNYQVYLVLAATDKTQLSITVRLGATASLGRCSTDVTKRRLITSPFSTSRQSSSYAKVLISPSSGNRRWAEEIKNSPPSSMVSEATRWNSDGQQKQKKWSFSKCLKVELKWSTHNSEVEEILNGVDVYTVLSERHGAYGKMVESLELLHYHFQWKNSSIRSAAKRANKIPKSSSIGKYSLLSWKILQIDSVNPLLQCSSRVRLWQWNKAFRLFNEWFSKLDIEELPCEGWSKIKELRGRGKNKCFWIDNGVQVLIATLQDMFYDPSWKTDGGFKSNYMVEVHRRMLKVKGMWDFKFSYLNQLELVNGRDRATGAVVQGYVDAIHNLEVYQNDESGGENLGVFYHSSNEYKEDNNVYFELESSLTTSHNTDVTKSATKQKPLTIGDKKRICGKQMASKRMKDVIVELMNLSIPSGDVFKAANIFTVDKDKSDVLFNLPSELRRNYMVSLLVPSSNIFCEDYLRDDHYALFCDSKFCDGLVGFCRNYLGNSYYAGFCDSNASFLL